VRAPSPHPALHRQALRSVLAHLGELGEVLRIRQEVDPVYELGAYLFETGSGGNPAAAPGPAVLFESVKGHELAVVGNILNSRLRVALALGTPVVELHRVLSDATSGGPAPITVPAAPCQELEITPPDLGKLPVPTFFEHETGPYITAGVIVAKGADGRRNVSFARLKPIGAQRAFIGIAPNHHLAQLARAAAAEGRSLEIAVTIGNHPAVLLAGAYYLGLGDDELEVAGALFGEPVEVVRCQTVDLEVPAHCELVIEGTLDPLETVEEGPVSEFSGLYERYGPGQVVTVRHISLRRDALFQVVEPGLAAEHVLIGGLAIAAVLEHRLLSLVPSVTEVAMSLGGCGRLHAVVALRDGAEGDARRVVEDVLNSVSLVKRVTVVDDDIDVNDANAVEWAVATRMRADRDLFVFSKMRSSRSDPLASDGTVPKLGIDATRRSNDRQDWTRASPPAAVLARVRAALATS
jgi:4-hydroxy-3-polyprenylbenzoate decarboxylase